MDENLHWLSLYLQISMGFKFLHIGSFTMTNLVYMHKKKISKDIGVLTRNLLH